jgi:hypothetical protein
MKLGKNITMSYDKYEAKFYLPDENETKVIGIIYGTYYPGTYFDPPEFVEKETDSLLLTWEDGTELTDEEYDMPLYFKDSDYHCLLYEYAIDMIYDFGKFEYGDPIEYDGEDMGIEYAALDHAYGDNHMKPSFSLGYHK